MRLKQLATILFLGIVAPAYAQSGRTTMPLARPIRTPIHSILPADASNRYYYLCGEPNALVSSRLAPDQAGIGYDFMPFLGVVQPVGGLPILISTDESGFRGTEIDPETGHVDSNQPVWVRTPITFRNASDFSDGYGMGFLTSEDSETKTLTTFDVSNGQEHWVADYSDLEISPYNSNIYTSRSGDCIFMIKKQHAENRSEVAVLRNETTVHAQRVLLAGEFATIGSISPDASLIAYSVISISNNKFAPPIRVRIVDGRSLAEVRLIDDGMDTIGRIAFSPDGTKLGVLTGPDFRVYDVATGLRLDLIPITDGVGTAFAFSPNGTKVYLGSTTGQINLVDLILVPPMTEVIPDQQ